MKTIVYRILVGAFLMSQIVCDSVCIAASNADNECKILFDFYSKYIELELSRYKMLKENSSGTILDEYNEKKYQLLQKHCTSELVNRQKLEDKYGVGLDMFTDDNDVDSISIKTLSITPSTGFYTVRFQRYKISHKESSPIVQTEFNVWIDKGSNLIQKVIGSNIKGGDSYSSRVLPPDNPVVIDRFNLYQGDRIWILEESQDSCWISATMQFTPSTLTICRKGVVVKTYNYYLSKTVPNQIDKTLVGKSQSGCYIVLWDNDSDSYFFLTVSNFNSQMGILKLYSNGADILDGSWYLTFSCISLKPTISPLDPNPTPYNKVY